MFDAAPDEEFQLVNLMEAAQADSARLQTSVELRKIAGWDVLDPEFVRRALEFYRAFLHGGLVGYYSLDDLLAGIREYASRFALKFEGQDYDLWFVLEEFNDIREPYFSTICHLLDLGFRLMYGYEEDRSDIADEVDALRGAVLTRHSSALDVEAKIMNWPLQRAPRVNNLVFIRARGTTETHLGFVAFRPARRTIGGWLMLPSEAQREWDDLCQDPNLQPHSESIQ